MRHLLALFLALGPSLSTPAWAQTRTLLSSRDWTSSEGTSLTAELIGFEEDSALLRFEDGRRVTVPENRFSPIDRAELIRARLLNLHWENFSEALGTGFFQSYHIPQQRAGREVTTYVAFGPNRFNLGIMIHSTQVDFRNYDQIVCEDPNGHSDLYAYKVKDVATSDTTPKMMTRVTVSIQPGRLEGFIPILKNQLAGKQVTFRAHSKATGKSETITLSTDETAALGEMLSVYEKAAALIREGVIQREPLQSQTFGASPPPDAPSPAVATGIDDAELDRFRNQRTDGRLGQITWTPKGGAAEPVEGLGWIQTSVVVRKRDGSVHAIPFHEMDAPARERILEERIKKHAGRKLYESEIWRYHYPEDWDESRQDFHHAFTFVRHKTTGDPQLFARFYTSRFSGEPVDQIYVQTEISKQPLKIPVEARLTQSLKRSNGTYSIVTLRLERDHAKQILRLIDNESIVIRLASGKNSTEVTLRDFEIEASQEAMALYIWDT